MHVVLCIQSCSSRLPLVLAKLLRDAVLLVRHEIRLALICGASGRHTEVHVRYRWPGVVYFYKTQNFVYLPHLS